MAGIIAAILGSLVAVFIGAWLNSVFTWKIKDKIKAIDKLYPYLWQLDLLYEDFIFNQVKMSRTPEGTERELLRRKSSSMQREFEVNVSKLYLYDGILDKKFNTNLVNYTGKIAYIFNTRDEFWKYYQDKVNGQIISTEKYSESDVEQLTTLRKFFPEILDYRKELTSFEYMRKELFYSVKHFICKNCNCSKKGSV